MSYKYEYAGFWVRFGATIIDALIMFLAIIPAAWIFYAGDFDLIFATG
ncbi:RDD family protein, partial [Acinetobacter radioresistens]|nr:RDD family protein [Acinetobacter radioresistens]